MRHAWRATVENAADWLGVSDWVVVSAVVALVVLYVITYAWVTRERF